MSNSIPSKFNEAFGWIKIKIEDKEYPIKYTIGSLIDLKESGIDLENPEHLSDPINMAKMIFFGLPKEIQEKTDYKTIAYSIPLDKLQRAVTKINEASKEAFPEIIDQDGNASSKKN